MSICLPTEGQKRHHCQFVVCRVGLSIAQDAQTTSKAEGIQYRSLLTKIPGRDIHTKLAASQWQVGPGRQRSRPALLHPLGPLEQQRLQPLSLEASSRPWKRIEKSNKNKCRKIHVRVDAPWCTGGGLPKPFILGKFGGPRDPDCLIRFTRLLFNVS